MMRCWPPRAVLACEAPCAVLLSPLFNQAPNQHPICDRKTVVQAPARCAALAVSPHLISLVPEHCWLLQYPFLKGVAQCKTYSSLRLMSASVAAECTLTAVGWPSLHSLKRAACLQSGCISEWRRATTLAAFVCLHTRLLQDSVPLYFPAQTASVWQPCCRLCSAFRCLTWQGLCAGLELVHARPVLYQLSTSVVSAIPLAVRAMPHVASQPLFGLTSV